jgi:CubicO group peptidase (beta-lactamase class C family)
MLLAHQSSLATDLPTFFTITMPGNLEITGYPVPFLEDYLVPGGIQYRAQVWNDYPPGDNMYYANIGFAVLGYLVEILSGKNFEEYCIENIFLPLQMYNTSFELKNLNYSNIAIPYDHQLGIYYPYLHYFILDYPAGGLRTTVKDLSRYLIAFINNGVYEETRILEESSVIEMHKIHYLSSTYGFQYGLGFQIWEESSDTIIGHTGGLFGVATKMVFRQSDKSGIIIFTNTALQNLREVIAFSIIERLLFWKASEYNNDFFKSSELIDSIETNHHLMKKYSK